MEKKVHDSDMNTKPHTARIKAELKDDGVHVTHDSGAKTIIPLAAFLRWCMTHLRRSL